MRTLWLLLLSAPLLAAQDAAMECANLTTVQTPPLRLPAGGTIVLKISSADDRAKDSHECMADYQLIVTASGKAPRTIPVESSDARWSRSLSAHLDGISADRKRVFGILTEGGEFAYSQLFSYDLVSGKVTTSELIYDRELLAPAGCSNGLTVLGMTDEGVVVVEPRDPACAAGHRWMVDGSTGRLEPLRANRAWRHLIRLETR
jgi:hypothetical protein